MAPADVIRGYLHRSRDALIWKLDGLSEYDIRRPLTPTGTNLLGLIKHTASVTADYLGAVFGRPFEREMPWLSEDAEPNADLWVTADESRRRSSSCGTTRGPTPTPRSTHSRSMPRAKCRGGGPTATL